MRLQPFYGIVEESIGVHANGTMITDQQVGELRKQSWIVGRHHTHPGVFANIAIEAYNEELAEITIAKLFEAATAHVVSLNAFDDNYFQSRLTVHVFDDREAFE